jgi:hypothetical protein
MLGLGGLGSASKDVWLGEYEEAKVAADQAMELIHQRTQLEQDGGADAARLTGTIRRCRDPLPTPSAFATPRAHPSPFMSPSSAPCMVACD